MSDTPNIGLVLLAAGGSIRLGRPKQLIRFNGKTLIQHAIDSAVDVPLKSRVLVLGSSEDQILGMIDTKSFHTCRNENWEDGMASSLKKGIKESLRIEPNLNAILILVSDQPFISMELLNEMIELYKSQSSIVVCQYGDVKGVPVLFGSKYFNELLQLSGDQGARKIMMKYEKMQSVVKFDQGNFDIDTMEDLDRLNKWNG